MVAGEGLRSATEGDALAAAAAPRKRRQRSPGDGSGDTHGQVHVAPSDARPSTAAAAAPLAVVVTFAEEEPPLKRRRGLGDGARVWFNDVVDVIDRDEEIFG